MTSTNTRQEAGTTYGLYNIERRHLNTCLPKLFDKILDSTRVGRLRLEVMGTVLDGGWRWCGEHHSSAQQERGELLTVGNTLGGDHNIPLCPGVRGTVSGVKYRRQRPLDRAGPVLLIPLHIQTTDLHGPLHI
ncbi:hypothetical protein J6590_063063 [Homalodisca vitripennis]|nr:hypothetical protein J6590_063063 [Homalodisca vitripennis]